MHPARSLGMRFSGTCGGGAGIVIAMILANRDRVAMVCAPTCDAGRDIPSVPARGWHYPTLACALFFGTFWSVRALSMCGSMLRLVLNAFLGPTRRHGPLDAKTLDPGLGAAGRAL